MTESTQILSTNLILLTTVAASAPNQRKRNVVKILSTARLSISRLGVVPAVTWRARGRDLGTRVGLELLQEVQEVEEVEEGAREEHIRGIRGQHWVVGRPPVYQ